jgi:hypothetical protein
LRSPNCAVRSLRKSAQWMWNCPSKLEAVAAFLWEA